MLPSLLYYNGATAHYKTLDGCYKAYSQAKAHAYGYCVQLSHELEEAFRPEFQPMVNEGISAHNCMTFSFTSDIYVQLPVYSPQHAVVAAQNVLVCRLYVTKTRVKYEFSHELYHMPDNVLLRLFDICPDDISHYYSYAQQREMRQRAGELV